MATLERLYSERDRVRLEGGVNARWSCRSYDHPLSLGDWAALSYASERYRLPGARLVLQRVDEALFSGTLLSMNRVNGCTAVAVVVKDQGIVRSGMNAGILGESLCLEASSMGIASCWITGSYRRKLLEVPVQAREQVLGIIALGWPKEAKPATRRRKALAGLCTSDPAAWPEMVRHAAELVQQAPSAMNLQPWMMSYEQGCFAVDCAERAQLDLGIALCHAEVGLQGAHTWAFGRGLKEPAAFVRLEESE